MHQAPVGTGEHDTAAFGDTKAVPAEADEQQADATGPGNVLDQRGDVETFPPLFPVHVQGRERHADRRRGSVATVDDNLGGGQCGGANTVVAFGEPVEPAGQPIGSYLDGPAAATDVALPAHPVSVRTSPSDGDRSTTFAKTATIFVTFFQVSAELGDMSEHNIDERFTAPYWDERYGSATRIWSGNPNPQLVREIAGLEPGTALDAGCGEGADAHWLARQGWRVTAMDVSTIALERGAAHAEAEIADRITWRQADLTNWQPEDSYDLVNAQFIHFPPELREPVYARLAAAVAPGGTLLVVAHHPSDMHTSMHRPSEPDLFFTAEELAESLDGKEWEIVTTAARPRSTTDPEGRETTIRDTVLRARRRP